MISIVNCNNLEDYGLLLQDNNLIVTKTIEEVILLDKDINVSIENGINVKLIDVVKNSNIIINIGKDSVVKYQLIHAYDSNHHFNCKGDLHVVLISIAKTCENFKVELLEENANANVELLAFGLKENKTFVQNITHLSKNTTSNISNFGIAMDGSNIVFDTTGKIHQGMSKSVCKQLSKGVVMDDESGVTSKPILLIDEYDVIANHGASIGKMSDESLFYLMSRGLNKTEAFLLILDGIIKPFIDQIMDENLKISVEEEIKALIKR